MGDLDDGPLGRPLLARNHGGIVVAPSLITLPTFLNGNIVQFDALNAIGYNTDALAQITLGRTVASGASTKPLCKVNLSGSRSVLNNATDVGSEVVGWDQVLRDTDGIWNAATPTYLTIRTPGWYWIYLQVQWDSGAAASRVCQIAVNGAADPLNVVASVKTVMGAAGSVSQQCVAYEHLSAGAAVYGMVIQNSGSSLNMLANSQWGTYMSVAWADPF